MCRQRNGCCDHMEGDRRARRHRSFSAFWLWKPADPDQHRRISRRHHRLQMARGGRNHHIEFELGASWRVRRGEAGDLGNGPDIPNVKTRSPADRTAHLVTVAKKRVRRELRRLRLCRLSSPRVCADVSEGRFAADSLAAGCGRSRPAPPDLLCELKLTTWRRSLQSSAPTRRRRRPF